MKRHKFKTRSIMKTITIPMVVVLLFQSGIFWSTIIGNKILGQLNNNAFDILNERVINRKNYIENEMIQHWSNLSDSVLSVNSTVSEILKSNHLLPSDLAPETAVTTKILNKLSEKLIYLLRKQGVTGSFVIFNGADSPDQLIGTKKSGVYIRDLDPLSNLGNNSDLMIECAPSSITKRLNIPMDTAWTPQFHFSSELPESSYDFFAKPFQAAFDNPGISFSDLGYWSRPFQLSSNDISIITYSVPLIDGNGTPYGVMGVEISTDYLKKLLPYDEIAVNKSGSYLFAMSTDNSMSFDHLFSNGPVFNQLFGKQKTIHFSQAQAGKNSYTILTSNPASETVYGCIQYFDLYNSNTPFEGDRWALIGIMDSDSLLGFSHGVRTALLLAMLMSFVIGLIIVIIVSRIVTHPITSLVRKVKSSNPLLPVKFSKINILEIDELSTSIELFNANVIEASSKLSKILEMASVSIGAFEYNRYKNIIFYTKNYFKLFDIEDSYLQNGYMNPSSFDIKMHSLVHLIDSDYSNDISPVYKIINSSGEISWIRLKVVEDKAYIFGVAEDITTEILEKKKIEHDRDHDLLTNLFNRRAFYNRLIDLFERPELLKTGAMLMLDLDNLKYINDNFGHDSGDKYIRCIADVLNSSSPENAVVSRMSGDEFYLFLYGYDKKETAEADIRLLWNDISTTIFPLPDNPEFHIHASMGYTWYPYDSDSYEQLIRFADFAMYTVKNTSKGEMREFDKSIYEKKSYLLQNKEELNTLIEHKLVQYHFQPIVDAKTGHIYAYEALMRSKLDTLKTPNEILTLARSQSKLYQIERLTWFCALNAFTSQHIAEQDCLIFINSIANQCLSADDAAMLEHIYQPYLHRIVIELMEEEHQNDTYLTFKKSHAATWKAAIAIDDFGSGYNGEVLLLSANPQYIKIDISIIRDIDSDKNKQQLLLNIITYAKEREIKVIAEGVETKEEMKTLIQIGIDYMQGYYLGRPSPVPQEIPDTVLNELQQFASMNPIA